MQASSSRAAEDSARSSVQIMRGPNADRFLSNRRHPSGYGGRQAFGRGDPGAVYVLRQLLYRVPGDDDE